MKIPNCSHQHPKTYRIAPMQSVRRCSMRVPHYTCKKTTCHKSCVTSHRKKIKMMTLDIDLIQFSKTEYIAMGDGAKLRPGYLDAKNGHV